MNDPDNLDFFGGLDPTLAVQGSRDKRKRDQLDAMMKALMANGQAPRKYERNPFAVALDYLSGVNTKSKMEKLDQEGEERAQRYATNERGELAKVLGQMQPKSVELAGPTEDGARLTGMVPADMQAAMTSALTSPFPSVQKYGANRQKQLGDIFKSTLTATGDRLTPRSILDAAPQQEISRLMPSPPPAPPSAVSLPVPGGGPPLSGVVTTNVKGDQDFKFEPKAMTTTINNSPINKSGAEVAEKTASYFQPGGKGFDAGESYIKQLANTQELLSTLATSPDMGAGGEGFQVLRKWAERLGAPVSPTTTITEMAKMQLGQKTLDRLGGLGAQISDADRDFMQSVQGSLGSDPTAARRMLMIEAKYLMRLASRHNESGRAVREYSEKNNWLSVPNTVGRIVMPEKFASEFDDLLQDKPILNLPRGIRRVVP